MSALPALAATEPTTPEHSALLHAADRAARVAADERVAADRAGTFPHRAFDALERDGLLSAPLYRAHGGCGLGTEAGVSLTLLDVLRRVGRGSLAVGRVYEGHVNALDLVQRFGTPEQTARAAAAAHAGRVFAVWHAHPGTNLQAARRDDGAYALAGDKLFASGTGRVSRPLITVEIGGEERLVLVPFDRPHADGDSAVDPSWWTATGMRASTSFRVTFDGVTVGAEDVIGAPGAYRAEPWYSAGAIRFAAVQLGGAEALVAAVHDHLTARGRGDHTAQQRRLARVTIAAETGRLWLLRAARVWDEALAAGPDLADADAERIVATGHAVRTAIGECCRTVLDLAHRSVGAAGMLAPHPLEGIGRDLSVYLCQPAPDAALEAAGRWALGHGTGDDAPLERLVP